MNRARWVAALAAAVAVLAARQAHAYRRIAMSLSQVEIDLLVAEDHAALTVGEVDSVAWAVRAETPPLLGHPWYWHTAHAHVVEDAPLREVVVVDGWESSYKRALYASAQAGCEAAMANPPAVEMDDW